MMDESNAHNKYIPVITIMLIIVNSLVFTIQCIMGGSENTDVLLKMGAAYTPYILENGEWFRLFTATLLHIGIKHLLYNMLALFAAGQFIEQYFGKVRFIVLYLLSGIAGNILYLVFELRLSQIFAVSAGASGSISGLFGAMVILALDPKTRKIFPLPRVLFGLLFLILPNNDSDNVNIIAHLGGMICGFIIALAYYKLPLFYDRYDI